MKKIYLVLLLIAMFLVAGCTEQNTRVVKKQEATTIKVGAVLPLTGEAASYGQAAKRGIQIAAARVNSQGGVNGKKLELLFQDDVLDPALAVTAFRKLVNNDKVDYVIGFGSGESLAMCPVAEENGVLLLVSGSSPEISKCGQYTFRNYPPDTFQGNVLAERIHRNGFNNVAILFVNSDYGVALKDVFVQNFNRLGGQVVLAEAHEFGATDVRTQLTKIQSQNPDAILFIPNSVTEMKTFLQQKKQLGIDLPVFGSEVLKTDELFSIASEKEIGELYTVFVSQYQGVEYQAYTTTYQSLFGEAPGPYSDYIHDNILALAEALKGCNPQDVECVRQSLHQITVTGATGFIDFDARGDVVNKPYSLYKARNGQFVEIY
jgi:branched-chain amino acid transport system substrate-binding protein